MSNILDSINAFYGDRIYPASVNCTEDGCALMINAGPVDKLVYCGSAALFTGKQVESWLECDLTHENLTALRKAFPFTAPQRVLTRKKTMGVGDRLGICTPGHIRAFNAHADFTPILAQQSIRELNLTGRTFESVLDDVTVAVFREGYKGGYGADGDHLKTDAEVEYALGCGYTMITLDCSEHIRGDIDDANCDELYAPDAELEALYMGRKFDIDGRAAVEFEPREFKKAVLIYKEALQFAARIYHKYIESPDGDVADFEISIDETMTPTTPAQHYFVAAELRRLGVNVATVAPRFCGEFQKGIDYRGDLRQFEAEMKVHAAIADHFGYKLSIHSGSDKFSVFPYIGRETGDHYHIKTAGTNWLQAVLLIAQRDPALYRSLHAYALEHFEEATRYYHVTTNLNNVPALAELDDAQLPGLFANEDARQLIHITYGLILTAQAKHGGSLFRDRLYADWRNYAPELYALVSEHIEKHMTALSAGL